MKSSFSLRQMVLRCTAFAIIILCGIAAFVSSATLAATAGHTGQALTLRAALHPKAAAAAIPGAALGRFKYDRSLWMPHALRSLRAHAGAATVNPNGVNNQPVQTFDTLAPPTNNFASTVGGFTSNNHNPVWSSDGSFIVFSSSLAGDGHDHLFYVSANGGVPVQITTGNGNEEFPALNASSSELAFTSTNNQPGVANLYTLNFTPTAGQTPVDVATLVSLTLRTDLNTGFGEVRHPTFAPGGDRIAFAAFSNSPADPNKNHFHIYYLFTDSDGYLSQSGEAPNNPPAKLTDGQADDTDPSWSPDGRFIAFASTADTLTNNSNATITPNSTPPNVPTLTNNPTSGARSLFLLSGGNPQPDPFGTAVVTGTDGSGNAILGRVSIKGTDDFGPAWSYLVADPYLNPGGNLEYLTFARASATNRPHDVFYLRTEQSATSGGGTITSEGANINSFTNNAVHLNTDDNGNPGNAYDDTYPTFAPLSIHFQIAYSSNRTVTYNSPTTGLPVETAQSVPLPSGGTVSTTYRGILASEVVNINPPILLRFSGSEVVHVNAGATPILMSASNPTGSATKNVQATQAVTFIARLSNREANIDDTGQNGSPRVYLQIKDPDSSTQDSQQAEHKVFTTDLQGLSNRTAAGAQFGDSGTATNYLYNLNAGFFRGTSPGNVSNPIGMAQFEVRGAVGGRDGNNYIVVGNFSGPTPSYLPPNTPVATPLNPPGSYDGIAYTPSPTIDPSFNPQGQEYECQYVNPQFGLNNTGDTDPAADYGTPYYLAGFDDVGAFVGFRPAPFGSPGSAAGSSRPPRPTDPSVDPSTGANLPAEWLQMNRLPAAQQDGQGGVLYSVTWTTPRSPSDFYLDVVAYDKAQFPSIVPPNDFTYINQNGVATSNFRIYDNTGGFTTAPFDGSHDILVVSDNTLGQKFGFSIFNDQQGQKNLKPTLYGAESYYTDVDPSLIPNCVYLVESRKDDMGATGNSVDVQGFYPVGGLKPENGLGTNSYSSGPEQRYSLWRILARGTLPESVLRAYSPTLESQPAITDPAFVKPAADGAAGNAPKVPVATRCVIWATPYTGDVLTDAGSLADTAVQQTLNNFVNGGGNLPGGGRLFVSGSDVAETLSSGGSVNNAFLVNTLNAKFASPNNGSYNPTVTASSGHRILYDAYFNANTGLNIYQGFFELQTNGTLQYQAPGSSNPFLLSNVLIDVAPARQANYRSDASLDQFTPTFLGFGSGRFARGSIDTFAVQNRAHTDLNFGGDAGLAYQEFVNGGRTVFMSFGLEALGTEYYTVTVNKLKFYAARNLRPQVLHNIVDYLRTGSYTGFIRQGTTGGAGVPGVTVYLQSNTGTPIPGNTRQTYSAITDASGQYSIHGVEPGAYIVVAYKAGFTRASTGTVGLATTTNADTTTVVNLNIAPLPPGGIRGRVVDTANNPVAGAAVTYTVSGGTQTFTAVSAVDGTYTISNVPAATYTGIASKPPLYSDSAPNTVTVMGGTNAIAPDLVLNLKKASVSGRAYNVVSGNDVPGATVTLFDPSNKQIATTTTGPQTDQTPNYTFNNIAVPIAGGVYTITASAPGFTGSSTTVTLAPAATVTGQDVPLTPLPPVQPGSLGGLITDGFTGQALSGVKVTISGNGLTTPITVTTGAVSSPSAPNGDSQPVNYVVSNLKPGQYTVHASKSGFSQPADLTRTVRSVVFTRADFTGQGNFQPIHVFPAGLLFFSVPYDFGAAGETFDSVFNKDVSGNRSKVAVWQPLLLQYVLDPTPPADGFHLGQGYWVRLNQPVEVRVDVTNLTPGSPTIAVGLHRGWNMIGVPNKNAVPVANLAFANRSGGGVITFAEATSPAFLLVSGTLYSYNGGTTSPYSKLVSGGSLQPWQAYWIYAYVDTTILIPAG